MILLRSNLFRRILLISLLLSLSPHLWATAKNGYYHKEIGANFIHYDVMARFGTPTIDGILSAGEWEVSLARDQYKYDRDDNRIHYLFQYDNNNFYVLVDVDDDKLWDDEALTTGQYGLENWVTWQDDGVEIYLDPNNSRDAMLTSSDRVIAFSIQSRHYRFDVGNNSGSTTYFGDINLIKKAVGIRGTVNNNSDIDEGYTVEVAIPWSQLGVTPVPLSFISANILVLEDDDGGALNNHYNAEAINQPFEIDRYFKWFDDGIKGPKNYARVYLLPAQDAVLPSPIINFSATQIQPMSAVLSFLATGDDGNIGQAKRYVIRYTTDGITTEYSNQFVPKVAGQLEQVRLLGLQSNKSYVVELSAEDYAGNRSAPVFATFNTTAAPDNYGKGRIYPSPMGRYFVHEDGTAFVPITQATGVSWVGIRDLYTRLLWDDTLNKLVNWSVANIPDEQKAENYLKKLSDKGINLVRIFIEDMAFADAEVHDHVPFPDGIAWLEHPYNQYVPETLNFLDDFIRLCEKYNMYVTITPWDNYFYRPILFHAHPYSVNNGGPITDRDQFVTDMTARAGQKQRLTTLSWIVQKHPNFFGWEMMNEWDNNTFATRNDETKAWQPIRIEWMKDLVAHLRAIDPEHMIFISSVIEQPQTIVKDFILQSDLFDFIAVHNYTAGVADPVKFGGNTPAIQAALDSNRLIHYQLNNTMDYRPILDLEFGPIEVKSNYYDAYSQATDEEVFHNVLWSEIGSGAAGMPLRWPSKVLENRGPQLTEQMWNYQENMAQFFAKTQVDFAKFAGLPWRRYISFGGGGGNLKPFAFSDGKQGLMYLLQDTRVTSPFVGNATVTVKNLTYDGQYRVEFWDTRAQDTEIQLGEAVAHGGQMTITLPNFNYDLMVTFMLKNATIQTVELPSLGNGTMMGGLSANSQFKGGISVNNQTETTNVIANTTQKLKISGSINVAPEHVGQVADILFVIGSEMVKPYTGMQVSYTAFQYPAIGKLVDLTVPQGIADLTAHPFKSGVTLQNTVAVELWNDAFSAISMNYVFFGYHLSDGTLVYNSQPMLVEIQ